MLYFLAASLPPIRLGEEPELSMADLDQLLADNCSKSQLDTIALLRRLLDLDNVRHVIRGEPVSLWGTLTQKEIEEALLNKVGLPDYVFEILDRHEGTQAQVEAFDEIFFAFFRAEAHEETGFLKEFYTFERVLHQCLTAYRAEKLGRSLQEALKYADQTSLIIKALPEFPYEFKDLSELLDTLPDEPIEQYMALMRYRFEKFDTLYNGNPFSLSGVMVYMLKLMIAEEWYLLDEKEGENRLNALYDERRIA